MSIEELRKDSEELTKLLSETIRINVKEKITQLKAELDREIVNLELKARQAEERKSGADSIKKRYITELNEYAWDQSDKFVKLFITLNDVQSVNDSDVKLNVTETSMNLTISNLNGKDYRLTMNNLLEPIDVEKSYHKVKTGLIAVYLKKVNENKRWSYLTTIQKRIKENQTNELNPDNDVGTGDDALINIMKKMYNSGDTKTKQMIAKAWTESQEKAHSSNMDL